MAHDPLHPTPNTLSIRRIMHRGNRALKVQTVVVDNHTHDPFPFKHEQARTVTDDTPRPSATRREELSFVRGQGGSLEDDGNAVRSGPEFLFPPTRTRRVSWPVPRKTTALDKKRRERDNVPSEIP